MKIIDSHCHCHYYQQDYDWEEISKKIIFLLNISTKGDDGKQWVINNFEQYNNCFTYKKKVFLGYSVGYHPQENYIVDYLSFKELAYGSMAIGEIGFDNGPSSPSMDHQIKNFHTQMAVALDYQLPALIHCRDSWDIFFKETNNYKHHKFIIHCFTGNKEIAEKLIKEYNCLISISGIVTYKQADEIREALKFIPMDKILVETDTPFLIPFNYRKDGWKNNNPLLITETIEKISEIKNLSWESIVTNTTHNFIKFFDLQLPINDYNF